MGLETNKVTYKKSWELVKLNEFCTRISDGVHFKPEYVNEGIPFISVKDVYDDKVHFDKCKFISIDAHKELIKRCFPEKDDILITKSGTIGRMALVPEKPEFSLFVSVALIKNIKELIDSKFLKFCLENFLNHINIAQDIKGGLLKNFHLEDIRQTLIPKLPIKEQQCIVLKLEELFSELDKGIEDLKTAQQQLKTYRQSVLKWAFEGKLTNENVKDGELPKEWEIKTLGELGKWKGGGTPSKQNKSFWENGTNLWVSSKDMKFKNINDSIDKITDEAIIKSSAKIISKGAIMFVMRSGILRHTLPVAIAGKDLTVNQDLQTVEPFEYIDTEYLYWFIIGNNQKIRQECSKDGTTVESIDTTSLKKYNVPIAPIEEQHRIVQEIESRLSVADKMEESIVQSLQQAEALRQSILKKAFSGELV